MHTFRTLFFLLLLMVPTLAHAFEPKQLAGLPGRYFLGEIRNQPATLDDETIGHAVLAASQQATAPHAQIAFYQNGKKPGQGLLALGETKDGATVSIMRPKNEKEAKWLEKLLALPTSPYQLATAYLENQINADDEFHGKAVIFEGVVVEIAKGAFNQPYIFFAKNEGADTGLTCYFSAKAPELRSVRKGSPVLVRGIVKEFLMQDVILDRCEILGVHEK